MEKRSRTQGSGRPWSSSCLLCALWTKSQLWSGPGLSSSQVQILSSLVIPVAFLPCFSRTLSRGSQEATSPGSTRPVHATTTRDGP